MNSIVCLVFLGVISAVSAHTRSPVIPHFGAAATENHGLVYITGGRVTEPLCFNCPDDYESLSAHLSIFNTETSSFDTHGYYPDFKIPRVHHTSVYYNGSIFLFGGAGSSNELEQYIIEENRWTFVDTLDDGYSWTPLGERPSGRWGHGAVVVGEYLYVFGGFDSATGNALNDVWSFHFESGLWSEIEVDGYIPQPRGGFSFVSLEDGEHILLFGGHDTAGPNKYFNDLWSLNVERNTWKHLSPRHAPAPRAFHSAVVVDERLVVFGGVAPNAELNGTKNYYGDVWTFVDNHWKQVTVDDSKPFPSARCKHTATVAENGKVYIFAGKDNGRETIADSWSYSIEFRGHERSSCHGTFDQLECFPGYFFPFCTLDCSKNNWCSGHGTCLRDGSCCCDAGWTGATCDTNYCDDYRGFSTVQLNDILLPKSIESTYLKLDVIAKKLENVRDLLPCLENHQVSTSAIAYESFNFYQSCLVENLCEVTECFESVVGCDEPCGSETFCVLNDVCDNNVCVNGTWRDCGEEYADNKCVNSWCDENLGKCRHSTVSCDDSDPCTVDTCDPEVGCVHESLPCNDNDCCTLDSCHEGQCYHEPKCADNNPCTIDICNNQCAWGVCEYKLEDCCYMSEGQYPYLNPVDGEVPRPLGTPLVLNGAQVVPAQNHHIEATAFFWLRACDCELIYKIEVDEDSFPYHTLETGAHIYGAADVGEEAGVVHNLPRGLKKEGVWKFCEDGVRAHDLKHGKFYAQIYYNRGSIRTQITFMQHLLSDVSSRDAETFRG